MGTNIYSGMTSAQKDNERKYLSNLQKSGNDGEKAWASNQLKQLNAASSSSSSSSSKSTTSSSSSKSSSSSSKSSSSSSNRYNTTVTKKDGTTASGYIENGKSYYSDGTRISAGDSVTDAQGKVWTMGGGTSDPDAGLSMDAYLAKYGVTNSASGANKKVVYEDDDYEDDREEANPYDAYAEMLRKQYEDQQRAIEEQNRLAVEQGVNRLNAQKTNINKAADDSARQAYIMHMQNKKALPQQLASQGATGGATETANLGLNATYQNNVNTINQNKANSLQAIDNAIVDLKNSGDLATAEQVIANNNAAINAYKEAFAQKQSYNQWATEFNANRADVADSINYRDKVYADQMAQQQLENQWQERNWSTAQKQDETNRILTMLENGLVDVDYASTLLGVPVSQLNGFVEYINKMRNLNLQATQTDINNTKSLISNRNQEVVQQKNENTYKSSDTSIANYINSQLGKNVIGYDSTTKQYGLANELENGESYLNSQQIYSWYKDPIIQKALLGVNDGTLSSNEATTFLLNLGYSADDIRRVKNYTFGQEGE